MPAGETQVFDFLTHYAGGQNWIPGSHKYTQERAVAMCRELMLHCFA